MENWKDEVEMHSDLTAVCLHNMRTEEKWEILQKEHYNFYIMNFQSWIHLMYHRMDSAERKEHKAQKKQVLSDAMIEFDGDEVLVERAMRTWEKKNPKGMQWDSERIQRFNELGLRGLIIDESHETKNHQSKTFRSLQKIFSNIPFRQLLTGTPFGSTLLDIWSQYLLVDGGKTFGTYISHFRNKYFVDKGFWGPEWRVTKKGEEEIRNRLFSFAIRYEESEIGGLPPKTFRLTKYKLSPEQMRDYTALVEKESNRKSSILDVTKNKAFAYRMICSGFIGKNGEIRYKKNPKLDALKDLLSECVESHKVVIFTSFVYSTLIISEMLKKEKIKHTLLDGSVKVKSEPQKAFQTDESCRVIVVNTKTGAASINLFAGTYCVFWENDGSIITRKQAIKRIHRTGQERRCYFYDLVAEGTAEQSIYRSTIKGIDAFERIVDRGSLKQFLLGG